LQLARTEHASEELLALSRAAAAEAAAGRGKVAATLAPYVNAIIASVGRAEGRRLLPLTLERIGGLLTPATWRAHLPDGDDAASAACMGAPASRGAGRVLPAGAVRALFVGLDTLGGDAQLRVFLMAAGVFSPLLAQGWPAIYLSRVLGYLNLRVDELALNSEQAVRRLYRIIERLNPALLRASAEVACAEINELAQRASAPVVLLPPSMAGRRAMLAARVPSWVSPTDRLATPDESLSARSSNSVTHHSLTQRD
jgi:hypothetical protein